MDNSADMLKEAIRRNWDGNSSDYDELCGHGIKTQEEREAWKRIFKELLPGDFSDVLDVGCGTGEMSLVLAEMGYDVCGRDLSGKMIERARMKARKMKIKVDFDQGDAEALNIRDRTFDFVFNRHLLWTLPHPEKALREWNRVLRDGGMVAVIDAKWRDNSLDNRIRRMLSDLAIIMIDHKNPRKGWYDEQIESSLPHPTGLSPEEVRGYLKNANFKETNYLSLEDIREKQKIGMPFRHKILSNWDYYLISGVK